MVSIPRTSRARHYSKSLIICVSLVVAQLACFVMSNHKIRGMDFNLFSLLHGTEVAIELGIIFFRQTHFSAEIVI